MPAAPPIRLPAGCFRALSVIGGLLAAALIASAVGMPQRGSIGETLGAGAAFHRHDHRRVGIAVHADCRNGSRSTTRPSFAFGFLEFDWDPNAPGGVPGFDPWPKHDLSVAETSPRS